MSANVAGVLLNTGAKIPAFGLGTWLSKPGEVGRAVEEALRIGYRHIDCAHIYGNEAEVGEALTKCFTKGICKREDVFITSKLWNSEHAKDLVLPALQVTLKNLQLEYVDLYLIHWPQDLPRDVVLSKLTDEQMLGYNEQNIASCWEGMEEARSLGLARAVGISNFTITKTENLLKTAKVVPAVNQVECHPFLQQQKLFEYCQSKGIVFEAYSPLGNPGRPKKGDDDPSVFDNPIINEIAVKHNTGPAQVALAFQLQRGIVVLAKTVNLQRVADNLTCTNVNLDPEDMRRMRELDQNLRLLRFFMMRSNMTLDEFWDMESDNSYIIDEQAAKKTRTED
jgi:aldehyde reductase